MSKGSESAAVEALQGYMRANSELEAAQKAAAIATENLATAKKRQAEAERALFNVTGLAPSERPQSNGNGRVTGPRPPAGDVLKALRIIEKAGGLDSVNRVRLIKLFYGESNTQNNLRLSSRLKHWKNRGWLVKADDGFNWVVAPGLLDD